MAASKRILVVDDDAYVRGATEEILLRRGYEVDTASEAKSALQKVIVIRGSIKTYSQECRS